MTDINLNDNINKLDHDGINKVVDNVFRNVGEALPLPIFRIHSIIFAAKICLVLLLILLIISSIIAANKQASYKGKYAFSVKYYKDGKVTDTKVKYIEGTPSLKCNKIFDDDGKIKRKECEYKAVVWKRWMLGLSIFTFLVVIFLFNPLVKVHFFRRQYFANPYHRTSIDYLLRLLMPLRWGNTNNVNWDGSAYYPVN